MTNFKEAILLNPNGSFLRFKAFSVGWGKFCMWVFPSGVIGKLGKVSAFLMNMTNNDFEVDLQIVMKRVTLASNCAKIEANKTHG